MRITTFLQNIDEWSFDVFNVNEVSEGHALKYVAYELMQRYDLINKFKVSGFAHFKCNSKLTQWLYILNLCKRRNHIYRAMKKKEHTII